MVNILFVKKFSYRYDEPVRKEYRKLVVDKPPIFETPEKLDYKQLLEEYKTNHGKELSPVKPRKGKVPVSKDIVCVVCGAPHNYIYDNNGGKGQYQCKICKNPFTPNKQLKSVILKCPHCGKTLEKIKERNGFDIYKCKNNHCSYYQDKLSSMSKQEKQEYKSNAEKFKLRYIYRAFKFDFKPLSKESKKEFRVNLSRLRVTPHTLGLILTYHVNYGLSARKTAALMKDIHGLDISHQTVLNYCDWVSLAVKPLVDNYPYELSDSFCGDETYIRVKGKWHYIFFFFDAVKKIILSYRVFPNRDTLTAIKAIDDVLIKLKSIPTNLNLVTDGNPIYLLAQHFFASQGIHFDVTQVIGLTNDDPISKEFRPLKQIIERLNRTFKGNYKPTCGFSSEDGSVAFVTLFVAYFNFLRPHSSLEGNVPVVIDELSKLPHMPSRWAKLIELGQNYTSSMVS
ncbi:DDE-type integrase/transposase/recombinase [Clostridium thermarum]|uniref:DDE-type integrase/transposase/recombinase n=2 Tax=Clostridium thermarum TaxID=1716543 RepID=UPI001A9A95F7|nr:DDE-type integrase/transposase/recombinase [Clostridium thermarum]